MLTKSLSPVLWVHVLKSCKTVEKPFTDSSLTYKAHVKSVCDKVNANVAALRRVRKFIPVDVMINIYKAFILPHLEYCAPVLVGLFTL